MNTTTPKIAIIGYGSMGKEIERLAKEQNIIVTDIFDFDNKLSDKKYDFDVAIDFSFPDSVEENLRIISAIKKNLVIGTTGWYQKKEEFAKLICKEGIGVVYGSNFSIGMQMFYRIVKNASHILNSVNGYDIMIHELHHKRKIDSPSGTANSLAQIIIEELDSKNEILTETSKERILPGQLHVTSTRGGEIAGTHTVYIDSIADTIELTHRAKNRTGFAIGALEAAKWIFGKKGFFQFTDVMDAILSPL